MVRGPRTRRQISLLQQSCITTFVALASSYSVRTPVINWRANVSLLEMKPIDTRAKTHKWAHGIPVCVSA